MTTDKIHTYTLSSRPTWLVILANIALWVGAAGLILVLGRQSGWTLGWTYVGLFVAARAITEGSLLIWNPGLFWRRQGRGGSGTKTWDKVWFAVFLTTFFTLIYVAVRDFDTPGDLGSPGIAWLTGLALFISGWTLFNWSSVVNPFFEKTVRIQTDYGHHVIDRGPYAYIRHPGYVGFIAAFLATPPLLPSFWICVLSLIAALVLVIRTALEDRTLQAELDGYAEYASRVRFRLIPGVW